MDLQHVRSVYFLGIGGIGMSALARWFALHGATVTGYDRTETDLTTALSAEGIDIHFEEDIRQIPDDPDLFIYTPAIPSGHAEFRHLKSRNIPMMKRAEALGHIASAYKTVAVAGTHGKTTTSTLITHLLHQAGHPVIAFLGGISRNYGTNFLFTGSTGRQVDKSISQQGAGAPVCIVEADEFDRSFLRLEPDIAIITSTDPDHLDVYNTHDNLTESFAQFSARIRPGGTLILREGVHLAPVKKQYNTLLRYSVTGDSSFSAEDIRQGEGMIRFRLRTPTGILEDLSLGLPGLFNLENAIAASAVALLLGITPDELNRGLQTFQGVRRRFDFRVRQSGHVYIDDYAHHPEELRACISAVRDIYPGRKITAIFQPHLFSRTRDLAEGFVHSLEMVDELMLLDIYPAREEPIPGVTSAWLLEKINLEKKKLVDRRQILEEIRRTPPEVLLTLGAGDIDQMVKPIEYLLTGRENA